MDKIVLGLQTWFSSQCNGDWEHQYGIKIETLDNPGWLVEIELNGTELENIVFIPITEERSESDWIDISINNGKFRGCGGVNNLLDILASFLEWKHSPTHPKSKTHYIK